MTKIDSETPKIAKASILEKPNMVHALAYIPYFIWAVAMFFLAKTNKKIAMHHIKYSGIIAIAAILGHLFLTWSIIGWLIFPAYMLGSAYLGWKAYNGEDVHIDILDTVEEKISEKVHK